MRQGSSVRRCLQGVAITGLLGLSLTVLGKEYTLDEVLALPTEPDGVVIEIVTGDAAGLSWALPKAQDYIKQLRARFADLPIAVVTHGREQFALTQKNQKTSEAAHNNVRSLIQDSKVQVHVCGTYAGWRGLTEEDFPDYVNVSASGPAQINDYKAVGYLPIVIGTKKDATK
ncbi:MAG: DsrE family protein [Gammaproteobacteria bacterium]